MTPEDRFFAMSIDEIQIDAVEDYDKNTMKFHGNVTLGNPNEQGTKVLATLIRGIKNYWKQIVETEVTGPSTTVKDIKKFVEKCASHIEKDGLHCVSLTNDMGPSNQSYWTEVGVKIAKNGF